MRILSSSAFLKEALEQDIQEVMLHTSTTSEELLQVLKVSERLEPVCMRLGFDAANNQQLSVVGERALGWAGLFRKTQRIFNPEEIEFPLHDLFLL